MNNNKWEKVQNGLYIRKKGNPSNKVRDNDITKKILNNLKEESGVWKYIINS